MVLLFLFQLDWEPQPIAHRVTELAPGGLLITKGDANAADDRLLYARGGDAGLHRRQLVGVVRATLPKLGRLRMAMAKLAAKIM